MLFSHWCLDASLDDIEAETVRLAMLVGILQALAHTDPMSMDDVLHVGVAEWRSQ